MRHGPAVAAAPGAGVTIGAGAPDAGVSDFSAAGDPHDTSSVPCSSGRRPHVILCLLVLFVIDRAPQVKFSNSGTGHRGSCGVWGPMLAWAATPRKRPAVKTETSLSDRRAQLEERIIKVLEEVGAKECQMEVAGVIRVHNPTNATGSNVDDHSQSAEGSSTLREQVQHIPFSQMVATVLDSAKESLDGFEDWPLTYVVMESSFTPLFVFAQERLLANNLNGDHQALLSMIGEPPFRRVVNAYQALPVPRTKTAAELSVLDDLLEELLTKSESLMHQSRVHPRLTAQVKAVTMKLIYHCSLQLRRLTHYLTCSDRFHRNRIEFFLLVQQVVPRVMKLVLVYFRMIKYMQNRVEPPEHIRRRYKAFLLSSQDLSASVQHLVCAVHGIAHGCLHGASSEFQSRFGDALSDFTDGLPVLKAFSQFLRPPEEARRPRVKTQQDGEQQLPDKVGGEVLRQTRQHSPKQENGGNTTRENEPQQRLGVAGSRETASYSESWVHEPELPLLDATFYLRTVVEHLQKIQRLDVDCRGMMSMYMGENSMAYAMDAVQHALCVGVSTALSKYTFEHTATHGGPSVGVSPVSAARRSDEVMSGSVVFSAPGASLGNCFNPTPGASVAPAAGAASAAGGAAVDEAPVRGDPDDVCLAFRMLRTNATHRETQDNSSESKADVQSTHANSPEN